MRCVIALMQHETNTFSPLPTTISAFASGIGLTKPPDGEQAIEIYGSADFAFAALVDTARERGSDVSVPIAAYAEPSGKVENDAFETIANAILTYPRRRSTIISTGVEGWTVMRMIGMGCSFPT